MLTAQFIGWIESQREGAVGIPHLAKNERDAPNFLHVALGYDRGCAFLYGRAHDVQGTH